jgi:uncharacterized protein (DUF1015 family)
MAVLLPFRALRPAPEAASRVAAVPYDVVNTDEARALVDGHPLSFLRVTRAEVDLPVDTDPYSAEVYSQARRNLADLQQRAPLVVEDEPSLYLYRLRMGAHEQVGLAGCFSLDEYDSGLIKKHEKTRRDKEDDRTRHITELRAQTGVVFLTYRASDTVDDMVRRACLDVPLYDFQATDQVSHTIWRVTGDPADAIVRAFGEIPALYIADGHHRAASAARARQALPDCASAATFIAVAFPDNQAQILPYNRTVKDLGGRSAEDLLAAVRSRLEVHDGGPTPSQAGEVSMLLAGRWHTIVLPAPQPGTSRADALDVEALQREVLEPLLGVGDPRTDKRIDFVGGIRGTAELERLVASGRAAVAFSLAPVSVADLIAIADEGGIMPPKSTWFEPKLRDGLLVHLVDVDR